MATPSRSGHLNSIWITNFWQKGKRELDDTVYINTRILFLYIYISLADKLQFNAFCRAGLQATTCRRIWRLESNGKRISCVFWQMIYSQWRPASGYMLRSTSFLITSGRHFRTNRNVNETEKKKSDVLIHVRFTLGYTWYHVSQPWVEIPRQYCNFLKIGTLYMK